MSDDSLTGHSNHCPKCGKHLTSLYLCPDCGVRYTGWYDAEHHATRLRELLRRCHKTIQFAKRSTIGDKGRAMLDEMDVELTKALGLDDQGQELKDE